MRYISDKGRLAGLILMVMALTCHFPGMEVNAGYTKENGRWKKVEADWYYYDENGLMKNGWICTGGYWYFLNPGINGVNGKMMTGWQWIDGRCYYLADHPGDNYPEGAMYRNELTPDGYFVDASGAWVYEAGIVKIPGKGIQTAVSRKAASVDRRISGGGSGGGGSHKESTKINNDSDNPYPEVKESEAEPDLPKPGDSSGGTEVSADQAEPFAYTIRYMDISDKTILHVVNGIGTEGETIVITQPDIAGYELCGGQRESFDLSCDNMILNVYYEKECPASPSEAKKVDWNLYFIEQGKPYKEIFKAQQGRTEEGRPLVVDFPETIIGTDRYYYHSIVSSPWSVIVNGNGVQKYYIEYQKGESLQEEADPDEEAKEKLKKWLEIAMEADFKLTGVEPSGQQIITERLDESNERLRNLISMAGSTGRQEVYLIAKGYTPNAMIVSQTFRDVKNISELVRDEFTIAGERYTVLLVGFLKTCEENTCSHDYEITDKVNAACMKNGHETVRCRKCGREETYDLPATGHTDADHDGYCDICYEPADEEPESIHYNIGDVQARTIGEKIYLFRCIDDDYEDAMDNSAQTALFLCDSVIRSDIDGVSKKLTFGSDNNYKYSNIREWLLNNAVDDRFVRKNYIGITKSYIGATGKGTYEQLNDNDLTGLDRMFQLLQDKVFILSVDEALKYRVSLWKFNGSDTNNQESQISAYSKGYYLRTPQESGPDGPRYGAGIYTVNLADGNIRPVDVMETSIGIRPAMAIPQG